MSTSKSFRPPQLRSRDWLAEHYTVMGDEAIAAHLGVSRGAVRRARERLGIASRPRGGQVGSTRTTERQAAVSTVDPADVWLDWRRWEEAQEDEDW